MRKTMFCGSVIFATLLGSACRSDSERAGDSVRKSVENVKEQAEDVAEQQAEVARERRELKEAQEELAQARATFTTATRERLSKLDAEINQIEERGDAKSKDLAMSLRARRDALAAKLDTMGKRVDAEWNDFRKDIDTTFEQIEHDARATLQ